jgi:hypothetical protein
MTETNDTLPFMPAEPVDPTMRMPVDPIDRIIEGNHPLAVDDVYGGQVYQNKGSRDYSISEFTSSPQMSKLMETVGFKYVYDEAGTNIIDVLVPDPERLQNAADMIGIPIYFEPGSRDGSSNISAERYAEIVDSGHHPIGTESQHYYEHDIRPDHIPALIVFGEELFTILKTGSNYTNDKARIYDRFTSNITMALENLFAGNTEEYNRIINDICPGMLNGYQNRVPVDGNGTAERLNEAIMQGLQRLSIEL